MLRKLFATPPSSPSLRPTRIPTQPREKTHHLVPYMHSSVPSINSSPLTLPAWHSQPASDIDDEKEWVMVLTSEQQMLQNLQEEQKKLTHQLQQTPGYADAFNYQLGAMEKLAEDEAKLERTIRYTERVNTLLKRMLSRPGFYQACMQYAQQATQVSLSVKDYLAYATAVQEFVFLEALFLETYQPSQPRYQTLISLGKRIVIWKTLNAAIDTYIAQQKIPLENTSLLRVSIWYKAQAYQRLPAVIEAPDHLIDVPQACLSQILNAATKSLQNRLTLSQHLYTLPCWKYYLLKGYQYDPTIKGKTLEQTCKDIEEMLKKILGTEVLPETWPSLHQKLENKISDKFTAQGLYPMLEEKAIQLAIK